MIINSQQDRETEMYFTGYSSRKNGQADRRRILHVNSSDACKTKTKVFLGPNAIEYVK